MAQRAQIAIAVVLTAALAAAPAAGARSRSARACAGAHVQPAAGTRAAAEAATLCLVNAQRTRRGLGALRVNRNLAAAARDHSADMVRHRYFEHGPFASRIRGHGYGGGPGGFTLGENIAWGTGPLGTPASIVDAWMHSPGHRANILYRGFRDAGLGVAPGVPAADAARLGGATYTLDFGARG